MPRNIPVTVLCNRDETQKIDSLANRLGLSRSAAMRLVALEAAREANTNPETAGLQTVKQAVKHAIANQGQRTL